MSLIASILHLDQAGMKALRITDPYSLHRVVYGLYPDVRDNQSKAASQSSGILWADKGIKFNNRHILMLANRHPSDCAEGGYGYVNSRPISDSFLNHSRYRFQIIVNPTRRDSISGKLIPIKGHASIAMWFSERSRASWGFSVSLENLQIERIEVVQFKDKAQHLVTLAQAHVQGQLEVIDKEKFRQSFAKGIGRGRSFGCGLLQIVPLIT